MKRSYWPIAVLLLVAAGCNQSSGPTAVSGEAPAIDLAKVPGKPDEAVHDFLEAVRTGNDQKAAEMISPLARQKLAERDMRVAPPGTPTAKFSVGRVEIKPERGGAYVSSFWTDVADDQGHTRTDEIVWVLRGEAEGWRVVGMVTQVYADQPPLILNFEDPEDMINKKQLLDQAEASQQAGVQQAGGQPGQVQPQAARPDANQTVPR